MLKQFLRSAENKEEKVKDQAPLRWVLAKKKIHLLSAG
jgi:hypothetical protein